MIKNPESIHPSHIASSFLGEIGKVDGASKEEHIIRPHLVPPLKGEETNNKFCFV
jgi:hypothetical protein